MERNEEFDKYIDNPIEKKEETQPAVKDIGQLAISNMLAQIESYAVLEESPLTPTQKKMAVSNITEANLFITLKGETWNTVDFKGCQFIPQLLSASRLGISIKDKEAYVDVRNNKNKKQKDINLKLQYQGDKKILFNFCFKNGKGVSNFDDDVVCVGDDFVIKKDMLKGTKQIAEHEYFKTDDVNYRHDWDNIIGAYAIAYFTDKDGVVSQHFAYVDKNRLERSREASASVKSARMYNKPISSTIWGTDTNKMCIKTAYHSLYATLAPFIDLTDTSTDVSRLYNETMDWDNNNKETKYKDSIEVESNAKKHVASLEVEDDL